MYEKKINYSWYDAVLSTYYRHFSCKEEIVFYFLDNLLQDYRGELKEEQVSLERYLKNMFCHFLKYKKELLLLHKNGLSFILLDVLNKPDGFVPYLLRNGGV